MLVLHTTMYSGNSSHHHHHHGHDHGTTGSASLPLSSAHRHYSDLGDNKLDALEVRVHESTPLTAHALHQVAHDIHEFSIIKERLNYYLIYLIAILLYIGLNASLLVANTQSQEYIEEHYEYPFHILSFWGVFVFTLVEAILLISTGVASLQRVHEEGKQQSSSSPFYTSPITKIILCDVTFSFFSAILYTMDPETFEVPAHYIEYLVQIPISCVNVIFVNKYQEKKEPDDEPSLSMDNGMVDGKIGEPSIQEPITVWFTNQLFSYLPVVLSVLQLLLYSAILPTNMSPERAAHMCEFVNEIMNGCFALQYALTSYQYCKLQLDQHHV